MNIIWNLECILNWRRLNKSKHLTHARVNNLEEAYNDDTLAI